MRQVTEFARHNAIAVVALFVALGSGGAYAASRLAANSVGTAQLKRNAVISSKVRDGSLKAADFARGQLPRGPQGLQGPIGPQGPKGDTGSPGAAGPAGAGYRFTTASGMTGPTLTQAGTYFVDVEAVVSNNSSSALTGECGAIAGVDVNSYHVGFNVPGSSTRSVSLPGMLVVPSGQAPLVTSLDCDDTAGTDVTLSSVKWWVSPVG